MGYCYPVLQRGAEAGGMGKASVPGKAPVGSCWVTVVLMICSLGPESFGQSPFTTSTFCFWNQPKNVKNSQPKM